MDLVVYGASGFGKEVMALLERINSGMWNILGFVDLRYNELKEVMGKPVLGDASWIVKRDYELAVVIAIGDPNVRKKVYEDLKVNPKVVFPSVISDKACVSKYVRFGKGCIVTDGVIVTVDITIGNFVVINLCSTVGHDVVIGDYVTINPESCISGNVHIGDCTMIGTGAKILEKKSVGADSTVGAGSVVLKNVPGKCTVFGVPARVVKMSD